MTPLYTVADAAQMLDAATSTITKHARRLGLRRRGRDYVFTDADLDALRRSLASSKPGRPARA